MDDQLGENLTVDRWAAIGLGFMLSAAFWWLYFDELARRSAEDFKAAADKRGRLERDPYTYLHIPIVAGIIDAVGLELVVARPEVPWRVLSWPRGRPAPSCTWRDISPSVCA